MTYFLIDKNPYFTNILLQSKQKARHTSFSIFWILTFSNPQTPNSDKELISPYNIIPKLNITVMRTEEMITNKKKLLIVEQILLVRTQRKVWRICIYIDVRV